VEECKPLPAMSFSAAMRRRSITSASSFSCVCSAVFSLNVLRNPDHQGR